MGTRGKGKQVEKGEKIKKIKTKKIFKNVKKLLKK